MDTPVTMFPAPAALDGQQLEAQVKAQTGLDIRGRWYIEGDVLFVIGDDVAAQQAAVGAVIAAHVPVESETRTARRVVVALVTGAVGKRLDVLTSAEVRALLAAIAFKAGAVDGQGRVRALEEWL